MEETNGATEHRTTPLERAQPSDDRVLLALVHGQPDEDVDDLVEELLGEEDPADDGYARWVTACRELLWSLAVIGATAFVIAWCAVLLAVVRLVVVELW